MQIGFIDFSKEERNKILATLKLLGTQTALDELGIGVIRDAYADILFPGISTIQTRAKYFVLIPYLFERGAKQKLGSGKELQKWIHMQEDRLVETLIRNSPSETTGIIGKNALAQKRTVKMKPSSIYWNGLRTYEIIRNSRVSLSAACNAVWFLEQKKKEMEKKTDGETYDDSTAGQGNTTLFSPLKPDGTYEQSASISLTSKEAEFLANRITKALLSKDSLLSFLIKNKLKPNSFNDIPMNILPDDLRRDYMLAKDFSDFIIGAHIRYNVIFSNYNDQEMKSEYTVWHEEFIKRPFDIEAILKRISCKNGATDFCKAFLECVIRDDTKAMDDLIIAREKSVKTDRSKLCKPQEYQYNYDRPVHYYRLDFRFNTARTIIADIIDGLEG
ncbi:MAG: DUF6361 family protein [Mobilitalea sp.]